MGKAVVTTFREWRRLHGLTQYAAAAQFRISQQAWGAYEAGHRIPRPQLAKRIAKVTHIPIERLLLGTAASNGNSPHKR